jgi:hypothetical protein
MAAYKKLSDTWRDENASKTFAAFATFAGGQGQNSTPHPPSAEVEKPSRGAAKAAKVAKVATADAAPPRSPQLRVIELPRAQRYRRTFAALQVRCPSLIPADRWRECIADGARFLAKWGEQAESLGWTSADLFGLHAPPDKPHPSYSRLSRYDECGLCWLLEGKKVIAITESTATSKNAITGNVTTYRRFNKPGLGPLGDSLEDLR